jgi:hypothetical protein
MRETVCDDVFFAGNLLIHQLYFCFHRYLSQFACHFEVGRTVVVSKIIGVTPGRSHGGTVVLTEDVVFWLEGPV